MAAKNTIHFNSKNKHQCLQDSIQDIKCELARKLIILVTPSPVAVAGGNVPSSVCLLIVLFFLLFLSFWQTRCPKQ